MTTPRTSVRKHLGAADKVAFSCRPLHFLDTLAYVEFYGFAPEAMLPSEGDSPKSRGTFALLVFEYGDPGFWLMRPS
jgi:hypothetical protein